jgi:hypothetical protein
VEEGDVISTGTYDRGIGVNDSGKEIMREHGSVYTIGILALRLCIVIVIFLMYNLTPETIPPMQQIGYLVVSSW